MAATGRRPGSSSEEVGEGGQRRWRATELRLQTRRLGLVRFLSYIRPPPAADRVATVLLKARHPGRRRRVGQSSGKALPSGHQRGAGALNARRRLIKYMMQLRLSCLILMLRIMGKLEAVGYPVNLFHMDDNNIMLEWLKKVRFNKLNNSANAANARQGIQLARYAASLIQGISSSIEDACVELTDMLRRRGHYFEFAPQALLVLLLLDCGAFRKAGEKMETLLDGKNQDSNYSLSHQCDASFSGSHDGAEAHTSVEILATILQILKNIGTSDALGAPSPGEVIILDQIMEHVSLCIDGFLCAKAYKKERDLRRTPCGKIDSELSRIRKNGAIAFYCKYGHGVEGMSERLKQLQEGFNLVVQALEKTEII